MPRPQKPRNVCWLPRESHFGPYSHRGRGQDSVIISVDEYETIRLIDHEGYDQEQAAKQMQVARTTVQRIYIDARKKLADALVNAKQILIEGGNYVLCGRNCDPCYWPEHRVRLRKGQNDIEGEGQ